MLRMPKSCWSLSEILQINTWGRRTAYGNASNSTTQVGWSAGGGVEWMFMQNWSAKAEYLYYDLGNASGTVANSYIGTGGFSGNAGLQNVTNYSGRISGNIIRAGVNYHLNFASAPMIAKF